MPTTQIVWFKRDLRLHDHAVLVQLLHEASTGTLCHRARTVVSAERQTRHWQVIQAALFDWAYEQHGGSVCWATWWRCLLSCRKHSTTSPFSHMRRLARIGHLRDRAVAAWCTGAGISFSRLPRLESFAANMTAMWATRWRQFMSEPQKDTPQRIDWTTILAQPIGRTGNPTHRDIGWPISICRTHQQCSNHFTTPGRTVPSKDVEPLKCARACSRLSVQLASGRLSMRTVVRDLEHAARVKTWPATQRGTWLKA